MTGESDDKRDRHAPKTPADEANRRAPQVNPSRSGVRTGNPQLDPEHARKVPQRRSQKPHRPDQ